MTFYEIEKAELMKQRIIQEQSGKCFVCGKEFTYFNIPELAHRIPKHKWILKKYGKEVIHHRDNLRATCAGRCNSSVMINPDTIQGQKLILSIRAQLD